MPESERFIQVATPQLGEEEFEAVRQVLLSGRLAAGPRAGEFEERFAEFVGVNHACAVNTGTAALHVSLAAFGVGPGDEVIVPPLTFFSTVTSVLHQNAIPVFADIDPDTLCLDPEDTARRITSRTKAIIPVHLFGNAAPVDRFMALGDLAEEHGLKIIEDCAQAHGTTLDGKVVGSLGHAGAFSFYATKHMTTGEGGIITSDDENFINACKMIRNHGMSGRDDHVRLGYNYRMGEMNAALGLVQLTRLPELNRKRAEHSEYLLDALKDGGDWFRTLPRDPRVGHSWFWCPLVVLEDYNSAEVAARLRERGVEVRRRYVEPLYRQPLLLSGEVYPRDCPFFCAGGKGAGQDYGSLRLPGVEAMAGRLIGLPNHPGLSRDDLDFVIDTVRGLFL